MVNTNVEKMSKLSVKWMQNAWRVDKLVQREGTVAVFKGFSNLVVTLETKQTVGQLG